jgi:nucleobase:cation symporter-1, NCS1 family
MGRHFVRPPLTRPAGGIAADKNAWPLLPTERTWGPWQLGVALAAAAAATWCYIIGESVANYLGFKAAFATLTAGSMIGMLMVTLATVPTCIRFGVDSIASSVPQFGTRGWIIPSAIQYLSIVGWNSQLLIFFSKSVTQLLIALHVSSAAIQGHLTALTVLLACGLVFLFLLKGSGGVERVAQIVVAHVFIGVWMLYILVSHRWDDLVHAAPAAAAPDHLWNYVTGVEIGISSLLSWWPYIGSMVRMAPHGRTAVLPVMLGMGAPVPLLGLIGIAGFLVLKNSDPAEWLRTVGGPVYAIIALVFVTAANLGTTVAGTYASAIGLRYYPGLERVPWPLLLVLTLAPVALVGTLIPELFFAHFSTFIAAIGTSMAPLCGIQIVDYYLLRRRRIDIRSIYDGRGRYRFWGGFNPAALAAMATGICVYMFLLDPLTYASRWPYQYLTASLPTALAAGAVYWLVTRCVVARAGRGGYDDAVPSHDASRAALAASRSAPSP